MRQVLIIALLAIAAMAAKNCSSVAAPSANGNYFMPPYACVQNDTAVQSCMSGYSACVRASSGCGALNQCYLGRITCLVAITTTAPECGPWSTALDNAGLYLTAGGNYADSTLQRACEYGVCQGNAEALKKHQKGTPNGDICPADFAAVCNSAPSFENPTRAPTQAEFTIAFGGTGWAEVMQGVTKDSPKYKEIETAVANGIAKTLGVPAWLIIITEIRAGSLIIKFILREDPSGHIQPVDPAVALQKLEALLSDEQAVQSTFTELATTSGITLTVVAVNSDVPTPTPTPGTNVTVAPNATQPAAAGLVSVAAALAALVAMLL